MGKKISQAGRPILYSLESLDLFEWESVQQRIANVESACHKCVHNVELGVR